MVRFCTSVILLLVFVVSDSVMSAEELIYDNSNANGYYFYPGRNMEVLDYGRSAGGNITRFKMRYYTDSNYSANVMVEFYKYTTDSYEGNFVKSFYITGLPHNYGFNYLEYEIPESQQFNLPAGNFGYSMSFSRDDYGPALASGGTGSDTYFWAWNDLYQDLWLTYFDGVWGGFYMQVYAGTPDIIPDPNVCDVSGHVFYDANSNGAEDSNETGLSGQEIFLDYDGDGIFDAGEPNTVTDINGDYEFNSTLADGVTFDVLPILEDGWFITYPSSGSYYIDPDPNGVYSYRDFGLSDISELTLSGVVVMENDEPVSGVRVEAYYGSGSFTASGIYDITDENGLYSISVASPFTGKLVASKTRYAQTSSSFIYVNAVDSAIEDIEIQYVFSGGSGEPENPYLIYSAEDLNMINIPDIDLPEDSKLTKHYKQMADIDLSAYTGDSFNVIGSQAYPFGGSYDGNNKTISNFTYAKAGSIVGLFPVANIEGVEIKNLNLLNPVVWGDGNYQGIIVGFMSKGTISDCKVNGGSIQGGTSVGGVCGLNSSSSFNNCFCSASVTGSESVGGICGSSYSGNFSYCISEGDVTSGKYAGGLCSYLRQGTISDSCATGQVNSEQVAGGLVGSTFLANIYRSFAAGDVISTSVTVGGLVGWNDKDCIISDCYSSGNVSGTEYVGGMVGYNLGTIERGYSIGEVNGTDWVGGICGMSNHSVYSCYWDKDSSKILNSYGGMSRSTSQMKQASTFIGWNNDNWKIAEGADYPELAWQDTAAGSLITTDYPQATYEGAGTLADPFVLEDENDIISMAVRMPDWDKAYKLGCDIDMVGVSGYCPPVSFSGIFDGDGFSIYNLTINSDLIGNRANVGFVGVNSGSVSNLYLKNINIINCDQAGAVCGENQGAISLCAATGDIAGGGSLGGICGLNYYEPAEITNCYCSVKITGQDYLGGLCGDNRNSISYCYSTGEVGGSGENVGGFCGYGNAVSCFWDVDASKTLTSPGGVGLSMVQMQDIDNYLSADWDFIGETANGSDDTWKMFGYPVFSWQDIDMNEFTNLAAYWNLTNCGSGNECQAADYNGDSIVNIQDLILFAENWLCQ